MKTLTKANIERDGSQQKSIGGSGSDAGAM
jgi:hypothetical protein